jgi:hypothetical protein
MKIATGGCTSVVSTPYLHMGGPQFHPCPENQFHGIPQFPYTNARKIPSHLDYELFSSHPSLINIHDHPVISSLMTYLSAASFNQARESNASIDGTYLKEALHTATHLGMVIFLECNWKI